MAKSIPERIAELKEKRAETIFRVKAAHDEADDPGGWQALREAERHEDVRAIEDEIRALRSRQMVEEGPPPFETREERLSHAAQVYLETEHLPEPRRREVRARAGALAAREMDVEGHDAAIERLRAATAAGEEG